MTDNSTKTLVATRLEKSLKKRYRKELRFRLYGLLSVLFGFAVVVLLLLDITIKAMPAFTQYWVKLDIQYSVDWLELDADGKQNPAQGNYRQTLQHSLYQMFPEVLDGEQRRALFHMISNGAEFTVRDQLLANPQLLGEKSALWLMFDDDIDQYLKAVEKPGAALGRVNHHQAQWLLALHQQGRITSKLNTEFFTNSDSREPEMAGIKGALSGTLLTMLVTLVLSFPLGVAAALYLEEFAPRNRWTDLIEININNLAAVPSIVFGLLGLATIINLFGLPRSAPLVAGIVLALMTLPTIIIASRASIKSVPSSIREAALGLGASNMQVTFGIVLPMAMPGILTGTIIGMAQAIGETAPLLMIGMVAFIIDIPHSVTDVATVLPVQIFLWADSPEQSFLAKTSAAILVLLAILALMSFCASLLRKYFEKER